MRKLIFPVLCFITLLLFIIFFQSQSIITTIKYFPIDETERFSAAETTLQVHKDHATITWNTTSRTEKKMYLRQDVSLLYQNGYFKGVQRKWKQDSTEINMEQDFSVKPASFMEAISFHHGEIHHDDETIQSIQQMSVAYAHIRKEMNKGRSIIYPDQLQLHILKRNLHKQMEQTWQEQMDHFQIKRKEYNMVPLTDLIQFEQQQLPDRSQAETKQIIGQLWEGLYKNYILRLSEKANRSFVHPMPIILFSKDNTHLLVLFELKHGKEMLMQQFPS